MAFKESTNIIQALERAAREAGGRGISIFDRRGQQAEFHSYREMLQRARDRAGRLAAAGIGPGDRLLVCLSTSWELLDVLLGAMIRGALPTLVAPTGALGGAASQAVKIRSLLDLMGSKRLYCDEATRRLLIDFGEPAAAKLSLVPSELSALVPPTALARHEVAPGDIAFMQLTSGSTGRQRAVMIRHSNVMSNCEAIRLGLDFDSYSSDHGVVSWLPLNHDMGLIGCLLMPIVHGLGLQLLRPETFLARPQRWLQLMAGAKIAMSPSPNFAYQLCVERVDVADLAGCDLSRWKRALSGAEMIRPETCQAFSEKFAPVGFDPTSFLASYGMAEATLVITGDLKRKGIQTIAAPTEARLGTNLNRLVSNGTPVYGTTLRISPPGTAHALPDGQIGEICVQGPGVFAGYYNDPDGTAAALQDGWLRTGDLGFLKEGELYITGRLKDVLIIHGHNVMPHEIEWLAESASGGGGIERCGAFSVARGAEGEQAVVVMEVAEIDDAALNALAHEIRSRVGRALGLPLADVVLVKRGQIPKTTSGKVQRGELRKRYLDNALERRL